jgi:hypothetical protein
VNKRSRKMTLKTRDPQNIVRNEGKYQTWFQPHLWPQILATMKKYGNKIRLL